MKLVVLGANGRTGQLVIAAAVQRGITVTAVVRAANRQLDIEHPNLRRVVGDPCDPTFLKTVLVGQDALISALGGRSPTKSATSVYFRSADAIVAAAWETGLQRVLVTSTALLFQEQTMLGEILRAVLPNITRSAARMEETLERSSLTWTSARPGFLTDSQDDAYRAQKGVLPTNGTSVSRRALAHFLVDAIGNPNTGCARYGVSKAAA